MSVQNQKLVDLQTEVDQLKTAEADRLRKEVDFLRGLQQRRGLSSTHFLSRDECVGYLNTGIANFISGS